MLDFVTGLLGTILYPLFSVIFIFLDVLQGVFKALAGVGDLSYGDTLISTKPITSGNTGVEDDTGLIFYLLNTPLVKNMLISIMVLGVFLLIIFTVMAFIKNAYSSKPKGWKDIIGSAIKGLANFIFLPVCCLFGIWVGNILLNAIDGATSSGGSELMSRKLFIASAYNANYYRLGKENGKGVLERTYDLALYNKEDLPFGKEDIVDGLTQDQYAQMLDEIYASGCISIYEYVSVGSGYSLYQINYLTLIVGGVFMMYVMVSLAYGMVRRMFILLMLYIVSPALCAMYPLDDGKAVGSWKSDFIKQTISAYGAVAGLNIFFSLLPIVSNIRFASGFTSFGGGAATIVNNVLGIDTILQLLIMVSGLFVVKELISMISGYIGAEDAYGKGASLRSTSKSTIKDKYKEAGKKTGAFVGSAVKTGQKFGSFVSSQKDRAFENKQRKKSGEEKIGALEWMYSTDESSKKDFHENRMKGSREDREEALAKEMYEKTEHEKPWKEADETTKKKLLTDARRNERSIDAKFAKKQGLVYKKMTEDEKLEIHNKRIAEENKNKGFGENTAAGKIIRGLGKAVTGAGKTLMGDGWKEAEAGFHEKYEDAIAADAKKAAQDKKGKYGEKEALKDIHNITSREGEGVVLKGITSEALMAMSNNLFKEKVFGDAKKGKINGFDFSAVGIDAKTATIDQLQALDSTTSSVMTQAERIGAANPELAKELASSLLDKLSNMDTGGNAKLEEAVRSAMNSLASIKTETDPAAIKELASQISNAFKPINDASTANAKAIEKYIERAAKDIVKAIEDDERRGSKK